MKKYLFVACTILIAFVGIELLFSPSFAYADYRDTLYQQLGATADGAEYAPARDPRFIAALIIRTVLTLLGIVFLALVVYGGFLWMTASGSDDQVERAKKTITRGTLGLVVILSAYAITRLVTNVILLNNEPQQDGIQIEQNEETFDQIYRGNDELLDTGPYTP